MSSSRAETINCKAALSDRKLVPDDQINIWCEILQFRYRYGERHDTEEGRTIYYNRIRPLLPKLKFPLSSNPGLVWKLILPKQSEYTYLCDMHKGLNADFVHQWFKFLALEVGARLETLRGSTREFIGAYAWDNVVKVLSRLHKMWETTENVDVAFGDFVDTGFEGVSDLISVESQSDGCEACILARIASHAPTIAALRATIKSRISLESSAKHPSRLRLLRVVEPWIELWQTQLSFIDKKGVRTSAAIQQLRDNTRLANDLYIKREKIKLSLYESKYQDGGVEGKMRDIVHRAENDDIDSYTALRASQRLSQSLNPQGGFYNNCQGGRSSRLTGERNPSVLKQDPAYRDSRSSGATPAAHDIRRVTDSSTGTLGADIYGKGHLSKTDSVQTRWEDVMAGCAGGGGSGAGAAASKASSLGRIAEEHHDRVPDGQLPGRQSSVRKPVRGVLQELRPSPSPQIHRATPQASHSTPPNYRDSSVYSQSGLSTSGRDIPIPDTSSVYSQVSGLSIQDHCDSRSSVSSQNTINRCYDRQEKPRRPERESRESGWTNMTAETERGSKIGPRARLSRPFEQPAYGEYGGNSSRYM